jgi:hypothetical protein
MDWLHRNKLNLFVPGGDRQHVEIGDVRFMRSRDGVFVPTQLDLSNADQFEDKKEADAGIESIVSDFDLNTLEVKLGTSQGVNVQLEEANIGGRFKVANTGMRLHVADSCNIVVPELPMGSRPYDSKMDLDTQICWLHEAFNSVMINLEEAMMRKWCNSDPETRKLAAQMLLLFRKHGNNLEQRPIPFLKNQHGSPVYFDMVMKLEWEKRGFVASVRNMSAPKHAVLKETTKALVELGIACKRPDNLPPPNWLWENVMVPMQGHTWRHCLDLSPAAKMVELMPMLQ